MVNVFLLITALLFLVGILACIFAYFFIYNNVNEQNKHTMTDRLLMWSTIIFTIYLVYIAVYIVMIYRSNSRNANNYDILSDNYGHVYTQYLYSDEYVRNSVLLSLFSEMYPDILDTEIDRLAQDNPYYDHSELTRNIWINHSEENKEIKNIMDTWLNEGNFEEFERYFDIWDDSLRDVSQRISISYDENHPPQQLKKASHTSTNIILGYS